MFKSKLRMLMAEHKINSLSELVRKTEISRETLNKLFHEEKLGTVSLIMIEKLCKFFNCQVQDIIEYIPDDE